MAIVKHLLYSSVFMDENILSHIYCMKRHATIAHRTIQYSWTTEIVWHGIIFFSECGRYQAVPRLALLADKKTESGGFSFQRAARICENCHNILISRLMNQLFDLQFDWKIRLASHSAVHLWFPKNYDSNYHFYD